MQTETQQNYGFDEFRLDVPKRQLLRNGVLVQLNPKAFDLLFALVENAGRLLTKDDLFERVWKDQIVEESNLTVSMSAIRRALGENAKQPRFITTVSGEGYCFVGNVRELNGGDPEFIVETHTVGRMIVEREDAEPLPLLVASNRNSRLVVAGLIVAMSAMIVAGIFLIRSTLLSKPSVAAATSIKKLTNNGKAGYAALSPDSKLFAFSLHEGKTSSLWLGYVDGGEPIQIRPSTEMFYLSLRFSPDGSSLYYVSTDNFRRRELYRIPVFGGAPEKLRDNVLSAVTFAPDGKRLAFVTTDKESGQQFLTVADLNGSNESRIAANPANSSFGASTPAWSPSGDTIAIAAANLQGTPSTSVFLVDTTGGAIKPLSAAAWNTIIGLAWLHHSSGLIVVAREKDSLDTQIWQVSYPGGESRRIVTDLNQYGGSVSLSADDKNLLAVQVLIESNIWTAPAEDLSKAKQITFGSPGQNNGWFGLEWMRDGRIIYSKQANNGVSIWTAAADGSGQKQLIPSGGINILPSVPDDEKFVVFQSNRSGSPAVWRCDIEGGNLVQLTGAAIAAQPRVSPDGKWIVYISDREGEGDLLRIPADGGEPFKLSETNFSWVDVSPDSKLVAGGYVENGKSKLGVVSIDGGDLLKNFDVPRLANFRLGVRWTPDGQAITYRDWGTGIWKQDISGGEPTLIKDLPEEKLYGYGWSPDGKRFAYTRGAEIDDVVWIGGLNQF